MPATATNDLDYLATRLHARRSRMAEGERLDDLSRCRTISELSQAISLDFNASTTTDFQRRLLEELVVEYSFCLRHLNGAEEKLVGWMLERFQIENIKVVLRGWLQGLLSAALEKHLVSLPGERRLAAGVLLAAKNLDEFIRSLPAGPSALQMKRPMDRHAGRPDVFLLEAALDTGYLEEWLIRTERLSKVEGELVGPLVRQQVEQFHFLLAARGRLHYGYAIEDLMPLRVAGGGAAGERFKAMLAANDLSTVAELGLGHAWDERPATQTTGPDAETTNFEVLESLAARRMWRLANAAFRRSDVNFATVVGFLELRRIEVANLITISEGVRLGVGSDAIRPRLTRRFQPEVHHV